MLDAVERRVPDELADAFQSLRTTVLAPPTSPAERVWQQPVFWALPACVDEATLGTRQATDSAAYHEAHGLGWLHGWRSAADAHPDAARLRTHLFERWRDALRAVAPSGTRVNDQVSQAIRWMRWGQRARSAAMRARRWTLSGYYRSVRWEARTRALASECQLQRVRPGQLAAFVRAFDLATVGLQQIHDAETRGPGSIPKLLGCSREALLETGTSAVELAGIEAQALGWQRFAGYCRAMARGSEEVLAAARHERDD